MIAKIGKLLKFAIRWAPVVIAASMAYSQVKKK